MRVIAPSILAADFADLGGEIQSAESAGVSLLHLDIMDGHFVPNLSFGPGIVARINDLTDLPLDVHLMLTHPARYAEPFIKAGADSISFHLEVEPNPRPLAERLKADGIKTGLAINPDMPIENCFPFLDLFDLLLIMSVFPGFGGQRFIPAALDRIRQAKAEIALRGHATRIEVDGGINRANAPELFQAGADILVMGTAFFEADDRTLLVRELESPSTEMA